MSRMTADGRRLYTLHYRRDVAAVVRKTHETPPRNGDYLTPADMKRHGGYAVVHAGGVIAPFAWWENARAAAGRVDGIVVQAKRVKKAQRRRQKQ